MNIQRASKAKGKSKAQHRAEQHVKTKEDLKKLAEDTGMLSGKFLFYPTDEKCDAQWGTVVKAILEPEGKLRETPFVLSLLTCASAHAGAECLLRRLLALSMKVNR